MATFVNTFYYICAIFVLKISVESKIPFILGYLLVNIEGNYKE